MLVFIKRNFMSALDIVRDVLGEHQTCSCIRQLQIVGLIFEALNA